MARGVKKGKQNTISVLPEKMYPYLIPENWRWVSIDTINRYTSDTLDPSKEPQSIFELYSVPSSAYDYPEIVTGEEIGSTKQLVEKDDVLLCKINPRINRVWKVSQHTDGTLLASSEWIIIRNHQISSDYLMFCFRSPYFREYMLSNVSGVGGSLMRAQPKHVKNYPIPIPPYSEQLRIVDRIESLFAKLDEAKEMAQAVVDGFEDRKAAVLHRAFSGELTRKWRETRGLSYSDWTYQSYGELGSSKLGKMLDREKNIGKPVRYLRNVNVRWFEFNLDDIQTMLVTTEEQESLSVKDGDMFICEGGEPGRCAIWHGDGNGMVFQKALHRFRPNEKVISDYLCFYLFYLSLSDALSRYFTGTTIKHLTGKALAEIRILLPQIEEQKEIVKLLGKLIKKELKAKEAAEQTFIQIDTMKKTILALAFRGELSTNDPTDESAEELLKEIL